MTKCFLKSISLTLGLFAAMQVSEAVDAEPFGTIRYDTLSAFSLGDGVAFDQPNKPKGNCIDLATSQLHKDTQGSARATASIDVITSLEELERTIKNSLMLEAGANVGFNQVASVDLKTKTTKNYERFLSNQQSSLIVRISLHSDNGRDWLDYVLKEKFSILLASGDAGQAAFASECGTHFIRAVQRESSIVVEMLVGELSKSSRETLVKTAKTTLEGKGTFSNGLSVGGNYSTESSLTNFERLAQNVGRVSFRMEGTGTPGLKAIAPVIYKADGKPDSLSSYLGKLSEMVAQMETSQGVPAYYITQQYPGLDNKYFDLQRYLFVQKGLGLLLEADSYLAYYVREKNVDEEFWRIHLAGAQTNISHMRAKLIGALNDCIKKGDCRGGLPQLYDPPTKDDILRSGRLVAICGTDLVAQDGPNVVNVMSDIAIVWRGQIAFPNFISLGSVRAFTIDQQRQVIPIDDFVASRDFSVDPVVLRSHQFPGRTGPGRAITQLINRKLPETEVVQNGKVNQKYLSETREAFAETIFGAIFRYGKTGETMTVLLGKPDISQCQLTRPKDD